MAVDIEYKERAEAQQLQQEWQVWSHTALRFYGGLCADWIPIADALARCRRPRQYPRLQSDAVDSSIRELTRLLAQRLPAQHATARHVTADSTLQMVNELMRSLGIDTRAAAKMLAIPPHHVQHLLLGTGRLSPRTQLKLRRAHASLLRLLRIFRTDRLPTVIRRPAELFEGSTALALILDGRIDEVVQLYDRALTYES